MSSADAHWKRLYRFASNHFELQPSIRMHYVDQSPSSGLATPEQTQRSVSNPQPCILAVHGNPTWSFYYRSIVDEFSKSHRVLAVDHVGCGLSDKPQKYNYCLAQHTENLVRLIDALDLKQVVMVVHDWGGAIGLGAAIQRIDRFAGLVVLNTGAFPPPYVPLRIAACRLPLLGSFAMRYLNAFALAATRMAIDRLDRLEPSVQAGLLAPYNSPTNRIGIDTFVKDIPLSRAHRTHPVLTQLQNDLPKLSHLPIRLVWGMKDWCFRPECLHRFESVWPNAVSKPLSDVGHYVMEEAPDEVHSALRELLSTIR